jgi:hypothetical protein
MLRLPTSYTREAVAGPAVLAEIARHKAASVLPSRHRPGCYDSETLCAHQREMASRGYLGAEIVETSHGFSLRYDSGLQDWGLIVRGCPTLADAERAAHHWQAADPTRRYVTRTVCHYADEVA